MNSPDEEPKSESKLDYAPPWAREQAARDQTARDQTARDPAARDQTARDQFRAALRQSGGLEGEPEAQHEAGNRNFGDDRPWHQRALEPERVPAPPAGTSLNVGPMLLRMFAVCVIAATVAAAVVILFSPKQNTHKIAQANALAPAGGADEAPAPGDASPGIPAGVPALAVETSAGVTTQPAAADQAAIAKTPQQVAAAAQVPEPRVAAAPPPKPEAPAPQIAGLPPANANVSAPRPGDSNPAAIDPKPAASPAVPPAPAQTAPSVAAPSAPPKAPVVLDENEINTLIRRGKNLLGDGDFSGARVLFERAANAGSAEAALALGSTYDPNVIKRLGAIMVKPDIESARKWYQLAAERGSAAASLQLANLPQMR
jgi:cytoskeletal protein RodZ